MSRLFAPVFWLTTTIVLARLTAHLAPYLAGADTLAEQVNGTCPQECSIRSALNHSTPFSIWPSGSVSDG